MVSGYIFLISKWFIERRSISTRLRYIERKKNDFEGRFD